MGKTAGSGCRDLVGTNNDGNSGGSADGPGGTATDGRLINDGRLGGGGGTVIRAGAAGGSGCKDMRRGGAIGAVEMGMEGPCGMTPLTLACNWATAWSCC
ncbi:MAG: hypothetical protein G01um101431_992 [Parcubacteria group bacterium Gr01-1014_31]|nr:MAG: hypothetical protein G01um101431_992 [Parcubacteria group bacterium Gr01-1014_31]